MDEKQNEKTVQNRHFQRYYQRPYNPRQYHYPNSHSNFKRGFWNGLVNFLPYFISLRSIILLKHPLKGTIVPYLHTGQYLEW